MINLDAKEKARHNIKKWGEQDPETILLAMMEELGELAQAWLQYKHLDPINPDKTSETLKYNKVISETLDLHALCYQLEWLLVPESKKEPLPTEIEVTQDPDGFVYSYNGQILAKFPEDNDHIRALVIQRYYKLKGI